MVRRLDAGFLDQDWPRVLAPVHPDVEMDATRSPITGLEGLHRGLEECGRFWNSWYEAWDSVSWEDPEYIDAGVKVVMWNAGQKLRGRSSGIAAVSTGGRGRTSGVEIRQRFFHVFEIHEGRIIRLREYLDRNSAFEAAGLRE